MKKQKCIFAVVLAFLMSVSLFAACAKGGSGSSAGNGQDIAATAFNKLVTELPNVQLGADFYTKLDIARYEYKMLSDSAKDKAASACGVFLAKDAQYFILLVSEAAYGELNIAKINDAEIYYNYKLIEANKQNVTDYKATLEAKKAAYAAQYDQVKKTMAAYLENVRALNVTPDSKGGLLDTVYGFIDLANTFYTSLTDSEKSEVTADYAALAEVKIIAETAVGKEVLSLREKFEKVDFTVDMRGEELDKAYKTLTTLKDSSFADLSAVAVSRLNQNGSFAEMIQAKIELINQAAVYERNKIADFANTAVRIVKAPNVEYDEAARQFAGFDAALANVSKITGGKLAGGIAGGDFGQYEADLTALRDMLYKDEADGFSPGVSVYTKFDAMVDEAAAAFEASVNTSIGEYLSGGVLDGTRVMNLTVDTVHSKLTSLETQFNQLDTIVSERFAEKAYKAVKDFRNELDAIAAAEAKAFALNAQTLALDFSGADSFEAKQTVILNHYNSLREAKANYGESIAGVTADNVLAVYCREIAIEGSEFATAAQAKLKLDSLNAEVLQLPYAYEFIENVHYTKAAYQNGNTQGKTYLTGKIKNVAGAIILQPDVKAYNAAAAGAPVSVTVDVEGNICTAGIGFTIMPVVNESGVVPPEHADADKIYFYANSYLLASNGSSSVKLSCPLGGGVMLDYTAQINAKTPLPVITNDNDGILLNNEKTEIIGFKAGNDSANIRGGAYTKVRANIYAEGTFKYPSLSDVHSTLVGAEVEPIAFIEKTVWEGNNKTDFKLTAAEIKKAVAKSEWFKANANDQGKTELKVEIGLTAISEMAAFADSQMITNACTPKAFTKNLGVLTVTEEDGYERPPLFNGMGTGVFNITESGAFEFLRGGCYGLYDKESILGIRFTVYDEEGNAKGSFYYKRGGGTNDIFTGLGADGIKLSQTIANSWDNDGYTMAPTSAAILKAIIEDTQFSSGTKTIRYSYCVMYNPGETEYEADSYESELKTILFNFDA